MTQQPVKRRHLRTRQRVLLAVGLVAALLLALAEWLPAEGRRHGSTHIQWRGLANWRLGLQRVAYCSEHAAAFRGWRADLGPVTLLRLRATIPLRPSPSSN